MKYRDQVDWSLLANLTDVQQIANQAAQLLDQSESFTTSTTYDALNRPITLTTPDASVIRPTYNEANLLEQVNVNLRGAKAPTQFVANLDYNAKGQRELCEYGNGVRTEYAYDPSTFRLINLKTTRSKDNALLQDLSYTYDPAGNITGIRDDAQQSVFFSNGFVEPSASYEYDAIYRLIFAEGREHIGQNAMPDQRDEFRTNLPHPNDGKAMRRYQERYEYEGVGNIMKMAHTAGGPQIWNPTWTRRYAYDPNNKTPQNNRLMSTSQPGDPDDGPYTARYSYDAHGNMIKMPHLATMDWDFKDQLHVVDLGGGGKAYYVYDSAGQRVRKVWEKSASLIEARIYLGGYEIFRRLGGQGNITLERETLHVMDDKRRVALVETKTVDVGSAPFTPKPLVRYQFDNHLGSAALELDDSGALISYEEYYPYGSTSYQAGPNAAEVSLKRYRYTGKERDDETGLYYHGARYYAPWIGRWTASDPMGMIDGPNLFAYARGNPIRFSDANGTDSKPAPPPGAIPYINYTPSDRRTVPPPEAQTSCENMCGPFERRLQQARLHNESEGNKYAQEQKSNYWDQPSGFSVDKGDYFPKHFILGTPENLAVAEAVTHELTAAAKIKALEGGSTEEILETRNRVDTIVSGGAAAGPLAGVGSRFTPAPRDQRSTDASPRINTYPGSYYAGPELSAVVGEPIGAQKSAPGYKVDPWTPTYQLSGTSFYGALPGPGRYYTNLASAARFATAPELYRQATQNAPHAVLPTRPNLGHYILTPPSGSTGQWFATSRVSANPDYGRGGATQLFIDPAVLKLKSVRPMQP